MKLDDAHVVARMADLRQQLVWQRDGWKLHAKLVGPAGTEVVLDPPILNLMRPAMVAELNRRIAVLEGDLRALGVEVG
jgi:hypothetical protein